MTDYIALGALTATSVLGAQEAQGGAMSEKATYGTLCVPAPIFGLTLEGVAFKINTGTQVSWTK